MKTLLSIVLLFCGSIAFAAAGDTTKVRTHDKVLIQTDPGKGHTEYTAWGVFPKAGKSFRKVYAELTFQCPQGMTCGEWDYLNFVHLGKRRGAFNDSLGWEIMRFITPYGLQFGNQWKHTWKFDITDFATLFADSIEIWYQHTGYEAKNGRGWLVTLDFFMVEGIPDRPVRQITMLQRQSVGYGNDAQFEAQVKEDTFTVGDRTKEIRYKILQTGHGMDGVENCAEFCAKYRYIVYDGKTIDTSLVWRDDCGANPVYPQGGTWIYDRASWCPGAEAAEYNVDILVEPKSTHTLDLDMQSYTGGGNYMLTQYLIEYGEKNFDIDASIEEMLRPNDALQYLRLNPSCAEPIITIRNNGKKNLKNAWIEYGWEGYKQQRYEWNGNLAFGQSATFEMPFTKTVAPVGTAFIAKFIWVNGQVDGDQSNDVVRTTPLARTPKHAGSMVVVLRTNNAASENYYSLEKGDGSVIFQRGNMANNTTYRDTFNLPDGCYFLKLMDDGKPPAQYPINEDGLGWWANNFDGSGFFQLRNASNNGIIKTFGIDFGTSILYQFQVGDLNIPTVPETKIQIYPNPVKYDLLMDLGTNRTETLEIKLYDLAGKILLQESRPGPLDALQYLNVEKYPRGMYIVKIQLGNTTLSQKIILN